MKLRYLPKLTLSFSALLMIALISAGMAFWSARPAERHLERAQRAYRVHGQYLSLSNLTYQLFKQSGDAVILAALPPFSDLGHLSRFK